jgi:hypothetical protein
VNQDACRTVLLGERIARAPENLLEGDPGVRRVPLRVLSASRRQAALIRWLPVRWLATALVVGAVGLLAPTASFAATSPSAAGQPMAATSPSAAAVTGCRGVTPATVPAQGFITNAGRTQGGHLWWRPAAAGSVCLGTVVEWVQYNTVATKTWRVVIFSAQYPDGHTVAQRTVTLGRGWRSFAFGVHQSFPGLTAVCLTATDTFGAPCVMIGA